MTRASDTAKLLGAGGSILGSLDIGGGQIGGRRNIIINGGMNVAQRSTSATGLGATGGYYTTDRFVIDFGGTAGRLTMTQTADGPSGFANCIKLDCTTADTSIAAGEYSHLQYRIEGQDLQQFKKGTSDAEKMTVSFYVKGNGNATYICELYDGDNARQISKTFSVTSSWNRITLTYDGDTTGAFDDDNAVSLYLLIWLHSGTTYNSGTLNTSWASNTSANRAVGGSSFFSSTDNEFFITGIQMELGSVATSFEHRSFGEELALCQRYYTVVAHGAASQDGTSHPISMGSQYNTDTVYSNLELPCDMRTTPTLEIVSATNYYTFFRNGGGDAVDDFALTKWGTRVIEFYNNTDISGTAGHAGFIRTAASAAKFALTAEL